MKTFKEMTESEFKKAQRKANDSNLSSFAKFCQSAVGYSFYNRTGYELAKWELWEMGYTSMEKILNQSRIKVVPRKNEHEFFVK
jgi:hypothetical protein